MNDLQKNFTIFAATIIVAIIIILVVPSSIFQQGINNAVTFINGLTTSTSIVVAFGIALNGLIFHEITKDKPKFKQIYFESLGLFLIPLIEIWGSYVSLANGHADIAVKTSLTSFLTAFLIIASFYLVISKRLEVVNPSQATTTISPTQKLDSEPERKDPEEKNIWKAKREKPIKELIDENDFEETRRCLLNSYHSYVQTHAGYIIGLIIGLFAVIATFHDFLINGFWGTLAFIFLIFAILGTSAYMTLRIFYWTTFVNIANGITIDNALYDFNNYNKKEYKEDQTRKGKLAYYSKAPNTAIIQRAIVEQIQSNFKLFSPYQKLVLRSIRPKEDSPNSKVSR